MHVIVVGCGRVGSTVARSLVEDGHDVVVIDRRAEAFRRLGDGFTGRTLTGIGFDRDILLEAGITETSAVAAVTNGDNSNILVARVAREMFGVERVVARIYDTKRAAVYERLGIPTVAAVAWTSARVLRSLLPGSSDIDWSNPTSEFALIERRITAAQAGLAVADIDASGPHLCLLARDGHALLPAPTLLVQEGDVVHLMVSTDSLHAGLLDVVDGGHS